MKKILAAILLLADVAQAKEYGSRESFNTAQAEIDPSLAALGSGQSLSRLEAKLTKLGWPKKRQTESLKAIFSSGVNCTSVSGIRPRGGRLTAWFGEEDLLLRRLTETRFRS